MFIYITIRIMANPRKFSEKIALQMHRQAEETARFEQIMREVSAATAQVDRTPSNENTLHINTQSLGAFRGGSLPNVSAGNTTNKTSTHTSRANKTEEITQPRSLSHRVGRPRSQAGPIRRPHDRRLDSSPYSSGSFLSPPPDTSWGNRRANSDSALHQSAMQGASPDRSDNSRNRWMVHDNHERNNGRPRSSCDITRISPRIHVYPSPQVSGSAQVPIGNNTGSLPDLTNMDFSSPISVPLDQDRDQGSSPYGSSPVNVSPTPSPTNIHQGVRNQNQFHFNQGPSHPPHSNHLSVPVNSRYPLRPHKGISLEENIPVVIDRGPHNDMSNIYRQRCSPPTSSPTPPGTYRSRPSPHSSPSPGGRHSAPCSPGAPSPLSNDYHNLFSPQQATQFQQNFEQLSMLDNPVNAVSYVEEQHMGSQMTTNNPQALSDVSGATNIELTLDGGYYSTSPSQLMYPTTSPSLHTTPNTPTSIPDITLTDFSSASEDTTRQDLAAVKQFEEELFSEDALRSSLEPLGSDEFQILAENGINFIPDTIEEHFRLDHS
ncbi:CREB-regulated transcription coactivator 1 isoform X3 [Harmonia axyridis]|uniref:CREB-regulated transcription coactivator 1 isoform X3 n=1 Tax=Harmonia axyridis TaxID=115357 RepID=UPI001E2757B3|nr:CREB-regulated transcription coactivator 1 isoform X3 [Harmonia axyridis]